MTNSKTWSSTNFLILTNFCGFFGRNGNDARCGRIPHKPPTGLARMPNVGQFGRECFANAITTAAVAKANCKIAIANFKLQNCNCFAK